MFPQLTAFAQYGNKPFQNYMKYDVDKAICKVPSISDIKPIIFEDPPGCAENFTCSIPQH
jgi:hypothetical protein